MAPNPTPAGQQRLAGLPVLVVGPVDVGRLQRELSQIDDRLLQQSLQHQEPKLPKTSRMMDEVITLNKLNLLDKTQREGLGKFLAAVKEWAPTLHMSFSADPSPAFVEKLISWLRQNIHPLVLLTVGLQPNIGAGTIMRTDNKYFDFSLGKNLTKQRDLLMAKLREAAPAPAPVVEDRT